MTKKTKITKRSSAKYDLIEIWHSNSPMIGKKRPELKPGNIRSFPIGHYVIFYQPSKEGIDVIRILHGSRDINRFFN